MYKGYQTVIPTEIRKARNVKSDDILNWEITEEGAAKIIFEKRITLEDITGFIKTDEPINSVELKKRIQMGDDKF